MDARSYFYICLAQDEYWNCDCTSVDKILFFRSLRGANPSLVTIKSSHL